ncbi:MAG: pilus assembly protein PilP [Anaeromyxobacter sp.]
MTTRLLALAALAALVACGGSTPPPAAAPKKGAPADKAKTEKVEAAPTAEAPAAAKPAEPDWSYSSAGKRDPFRSFLSEVSTQSNVLATRCTTPLGRYEVEQLKLVAIITGLEDPVAMVQAPNGVGYTVRRGACIGKNGGIVAAVRSGEDPDLGVGGPRRRHPRRNADPAPPPQGSGPLARGVAP